MKRWALEAGEGENTTLVVTNEPEYCSSKERNDLWFVANILPT